MSLVEKHSSDLWKAPTEQEGLLAVALHTVAYKGKQKEAVGQLPI